MLLALLLALTAVAHGFLLSYFYQPRTTLLWRICAGASTGLTVLGLVGLILASFFGMTPLALILIVAVMLAPFVVLRSAALRGHIASDWRIAKARFNSKSVGTLCLAIALCFVFSFAMYERGGEIFTGFDNNLGDLPFHISIITGFAEGGNFPPEHTEYAGVRLTYPFLVDFIAALFVRLGATLGAALLIENSLLALAFVGLVYVWGRELTGSKAAGMLGVALVLLSGGLGWWMFLRDASAQGVFATLADLPRNYTITATGGYRWGNAITVLLVPQRGLLLGAPLFLLAATLLWQVARGEDADGGRDEAAREGQSKRGRVESRREKRRGKSRGESTESLAVEAQTVAPAALASRRMLAGGVIAGLLPLAHAHSFALLIAVGAVVVVLFYKETGWRAWALFFVAAFALAVPQLFWVTRDSGAQAGTFVAWEFGWDRGVDNPLWFWFKNTGLLIPLIVLALVWRRDVGSGEKAPLLSAKARRFYIPLACIFVGANLLKLSPWVWDNIKVLFIWFIASAPLVALPLVHFWRAGGGVWRRVAVACVILTLTAAGALDVWRVVTGVAEQRIFSREDREFAALIERETPPGARILHAPVYNHPTFLTGRRSIMGYPGHLWTHGIDYLPRERQIKSVYAGAPEAAEVLQRHRVNYIVVGAHERGALKVNEAALGGYTLVSEAGSSRLYRVAAADAGR